MKCLVNVRSSLHLSHLAVKDFFQYRPAKVLDSAPTAKWMTQIVLTHQTELAAALMASFRCSCQEFVHQSTNQITQPIKVTTLKVATIPR